MNALEPMEPTENYLDTLDEGYIIWIGVDQDPRPIFSMPMDFAPEPILLLSGTCLTIFISLPATFAAMAVRIC